MARSVLITGATRGLGEAMASGFAARGHRVAGCGRTGDALARLESRLGPPHRFDRVDLAAAGEVEEWAADVLAERGPPDLLLNNAARINRPAELWRVPREEFAGLIEVNVVGLFRVLRAFLPAMVERGTGVVVNFSSGWGRSTSPQMAPYCASKYAVEGLTSALAQELPRGMAAVALNPGVIDTEMLRAAWGEGAAAHPPPEDWAERAVPFLLGIGPAENGRSLTVS